MNAIDQFGMETVDSITILFKANRNVQALVVLYSAIDTLAWASLSTGDVSRSDFCRWVNVYLKPESELGCSAEDLYGARCAILHSSTAESKMSRDGRVKELWYAESPKGVLRLEAYAKQTGQDAKIVYLPGFFGAFSLAVTSFAEDLALDPDKYGICCERIKRWIRFVPGASVEAMLRLREDR